ncbi:aldo/keto reductase [Promicromonospora sp. NPDC059942]|uniref:aldo/keto reductase n=1 Tax=Promicromonospora sp. NPDC059942 TaxID=3347009 RepID=UPI003659C965
MNPNNTPGQPLPVSRIGLGTMRFADAPDLRRGATAPIWHAPTDRDDLVSLVRRAVELGVDHFDTADAYALGEGERLLAKALGTADVTIATKVGVARPSPAEWVPVGRPAYLRQQIEASLRRLGRESIDLLYLHRVDPDVPVEDQVGALKQALDEGKVRRIGLSEVDVATLDRAHAVAPLAAVQNLYNYAARDHDPVLRRTAELGIAFVPFFPVSPGDAVAGSPVPSVARETGATSTQVQLAWLLRRGAHVLPIPGTTVAGHLAENVAAADLDLSADQLARLDGWTPAAAGA